jgi:hypothetical protein
VKGFVMHDLRAFIAQAANGALTHRKDRGNGLVSWSWREANGYTFVIARGDEMLHKEWTLGTSRRQLEDDIKLRVLVILDAGFPMLARGAA